MQPSTRSVLPGGLAIPVSPTCRSSSGIRAFLVDHVAGRGLEQLTEVGKRDAPIAMSFTAYIPVTVNLTGQLAERGVAVIVLTDGPFSPLSPSATVFLEIPEADHAAFRSLTATFCGAMSLGVATAAKRNQG